MIRDEDLTWIFHKSQQVKSEQHLYLKKIYLKVHSLVSEWTHQTAAAGSRSPVTARLSGAAVFGARR